MIVILFHYSGFAQASMNYGLWEMCIHGDVMNIKEDRCFAFESKNKFDEHRNFQAFKSPGKKRYAVIA